MPAKRDVDGVPISWTDEYTVIFCDVCINFITKHGRGQTFRWREIHDQFTNIIGIRCFLKSLKNKYEAMKKNWRLWKYLKREETGLGWNCTTGKLDCSNEWWEKKLKEKPEAKKFRFKGVSPLVEEKWDHLFGDVVATRGNCVALLLTPEFDQLASQVDEIQDKKCEIQDKEGWTGGAYNECSPYSNRLENLEDQEDGVWQDLIEDVRGNIEPKGNLPNTSGLNSTRGVKRKRRESGGSTLFRQHLKRADERHSEIMGLINQGTNTKINEVSIDQIMDIMNRIAANSDFEVGGDTWCHAMLMFRDPTSREIFSKMPNDDARMRWLEFAHKRNTI